MVVIFNNKKYYQYNNKLLIIDIRRIATNDLVATRDSKRDQEKHENVVYYYSISNVCTGATVNTTYVT